MKILIIGSSTLIKKSSEKDEFNNACVEIGKEIARRGHKIIICSASKKTADYYVLQGYCSERTNSEVVVYRPSRDCLQEEADTGFEQLSRDPDIRCQNFKIKTVFGGWRPVHLKAIKMSDIVIAVGGTQRGLGQVVRFSEIEGKPIIVIPSFGCAAGEIWTDIKHYYDQETQTILEQRSISNGWSKRIITIAEKYYRHNPFDEIHITNLIIKFIISIILVIGWLFLLFAKNPFISSDWIFIFMLLFASILGSILRNALVDQNIITSNWGQRNILLQCLIGVILIIPVFSIPQLFGYMLNEQFASISSLVDARRIGFVLSIFSLLASLFQEEAFEKTFEFLKKLIG